MIYTIFVVMLLIAVGFYWFIIRPLKISSNAATHKDVEDLYQRPKSFTDLLPWMDFDYVNQTFTLEDGSPGVMFEVSMLPTEARPPDYLSEIEDGIRSALNFSIPECDTPWILQFYVQDDGDMSSFIKSYEDYFPEERKTHPFTQHFLKCMREHIQRISNEKGYFIDNMVSGSPWGAKERKVRCFLYKRLSKQDKEEFENSDDNNAEKQLNEIMEKLSTQLQATGLIVNRCLEEEFVRWMLAWLNPENVKKFNLNDITTTNQEKPFGFDLSRVLSLQEPTSKEGSWYFDAKPHRVITVDSLRRSPVPGHLTGERRIGDRNLAFFDDLPAGSIANVTVVIKAQDQVKNHLSRLQYASKGDSAEAELTASDATDALQAIQKGDNLYPTSINIFIRGSDNRDLKDKLNKTHSLLITHGLNTINEKNMMLPLYAYIRNLPMNFEPEKERIFPLSRYVFSSHIARLVPLWGRDRGTQNHGFLFYNRGGEPLSFDPFNPNDRAGNAFGLLLGPPGAGKSAMMVYLLMQTIALYNTRIFVIEKGNSFELLAEHCKAMGMSVNSVSLTQKSDISLPPFANALRMLEREEKKEEDLNKSYLVESNLDNFDASKIDEYIQEVMQDENNDSDEERDLLGEMELIGKIMITGGDEEEEKKMTRSNRLILRQAIVDAAVKKRDALVSKKLTKEPVSDFDEVVITSDVVNSLRDLSRDDSRHEKSRLRAEEMADAMELFCTGLLGKFFNRPGKLWPENDLTVMDLGIFSQDAYKDGLSIAVVGLMNIITGIAERDQHSKRPILVIADEPHLLFDNVLLVVLFIKLVKMYRKLGCWPWFLTQNMEDFPGDARKLLSMLEWFIALVCPKEQIELISNFKDLTQEQKSLLLAAQKESKKFTEAVVISKTILALIRNVPPPISLALAQTEQHEKAVRAEIMKEKQCSKLEASYEVANRIIEYKEKEVLDRA